MEAKVKYKLIVFLILDNKLPTSHFLLFYSGLADLEMKDEDEENLHLDEELSLSSTFIQDERIN